MPVKEIGETRRILAQRRALSSCFSECARRIQTGRRSAKVEGKEMKDESELTGLFT
jgi:hypothetical protein